MSEILFKEESYKIIGLCMKIHSALGLGLKEINYKDAMEIDFLGENISYEREKRFVVKYKNKILRNPYVLLMIRLF
jgi:GxxExxY protein